MPRSIGEANRDISAVRRMMAGKAQSAAALAQVQRIDAEGPPEARAYALHTLIEAYWFGGDEEKAYVPFSQAIAWYDEHPEWFDDTDRSNLFWSFKWMISGLRGFPRVPLQQLQNTMADMERRYALQGFSLDAPYQQRWQLAQHLGSPNEQALFDDWVRQPRDEMSDCQLCATGDRVEYFIENGRVDEGLALMQATIADSSIRSECFSEPATMYAVAQFAYLERGDTEAAVRAHHRCRTYWDESFTYGSGSRDLRLLHDRAFALEMVRGQCIEFLARTRNVDAAVRLLQSNQRFLTQSDTPLSRLRFLTGVGAALLVLVNHQDCGEMTISVGLPDIETLSQLLVWVQAQATELAAAFDARNGTSHQSDVMHQSWQVEPYPTQLDLRLVVEQPPEPVQPDSPEPGDDQSPAPTSDLVTQAEKLSRGSDPAGAIATYLQAADSFEQSGQLVDAGFARAEAGHLALAADDLDGAKACLSRAYQLLLAAKTAPEFVAPVAITLADCLAKAGGADAAEEVLGQVAAQLDAALDEPSPENVAADVAKAHEDDLRWARVSIDYQRAENLVRLGDAAAGAELAQRSAERFADLALFQQAAQAFQCAGVAWTDCDDDKAVWCLQSAVEGFGLAVRRQEKSQAVNLLVTLLQKLGRDEEAAAAATS